MDMHTLENLRYLINELDMWACRSEQIKREIEWYRNRKKTTTSTPTDIINLLTDSLNDIAEHVKSLKRDIQEAESFIDSVPDKSTQDIISYRYRYGLSWQAVSLRVGGYIPEDTLRVAVHRYLDKFIDFDSIHAENVV